MKKMAFFHRRFFELIFQLIQVDSARRLFFFFFCILYFLFLSIFRCVLLRFHSFENEMMVHTHASVLISNLTDHVNRRIGEMGIVWTVFDYTGHSIREYNVMYVTCAVALLVYMCAYVSLSVVQIRRLTTTTLTISSYTHSHNISGSAIQWAIGLIFVHQFLSIRSGFVARFIVCQWFWKDRFGESFAIRMFRLLLVFLLSFKLYCIVYTTDVFVK